MTMIKKRSPRDKMKDAFAKVASVVHAGKWHSIRLTVWQVSFGDDNWNATFKADGEEVTGIGRSPQSAIDIAATNFAKYMRANK